MKTTTEKISFIKKCFGENFKLSRQGRNIQVKCPVCNPEKEKLKLSICLETWVCHCWVCNTKGKTPYYIIKDNVSSKLAKEYLELFSNKVEKEISDHEKEYTVEFPDTFCFLGEYLDSTKNLDARDCLNYLKRRGIDKKLIWKHKIGFFNSGRLNRRVVFPSFDKEQNLNFYVTRSIDDDGPFKYINCKADKKNIVFDEFRIDWTKELIIVEGVFDMMKCPENSTCILGSSLSDSHLLFKKIIVNKTPIVLGLDSDMKEKTYKIAKLLSQYNINVKIVDLGTHHDIGSMSKEIVKQKCLDADIYCMENHLLNLIGTINSGSMF